MAIYLMIVQPAYSQTKSTIEYDSTLGFDVIRNGEVVGSHVTTFLHEGPELTVESRMGLNIKFLGIPIYSFDYWSLEKWSEGVLSNLDVEVKDGSEQISVSALMGKDGLIVMSPSGTYVVREPIISTNHWNSDVLTQKRVLNTLTGKINQVKLINKGKERISIKDSTILATRYDYTGELKDTSVWYDSDGQWSKLEFKARDGSTIEYICNTCDAGL